MTTYPPVKVGQWRLPTGNDFEIWLMPGGILDCRWETFPPSDEDIKAYQALIPSVQNKLEIMLGMRVKFISPLDLHKPQSD